MVLCASVVRAQTGEFKVLYNFTSGSDGANPKAAVTIGRGGVLYGTAEMAGYGVGFGTIFSLTPPTTQGGTWSFDTLFQFEGTNGAFPLGAPAISPDGVLYAGSSAGDTGDGGTIVSLTPPTALGSSWTPSVIYSFAPGAPEQEWDRA